MPAALSCGLDELLPAKGLRLTSVQWMSAVPFPVLYSGLRFGAKPAPGGTALFCFG